jgi:Transglutaminase-like superfamily/Bacterial transglutaminase-like N-terminal region
VNEIRIYPYFSEEQEILQHDLTISNYPDVQVYRDYWGNRVGLFSIIESHDELVIESKLLIRTTRNNAVEPKPDSDFIHLKAEVQNNLQLIEMMKPEIIAKQDEIQRICDTVYEENKCIANVVSECSDHIFQNFTYSKGITTIETTVDEILEHQRGVCQDFAHLLLQILRTLEIPCRYVSGYICPHKNGMRGEGATHAWVEAWIPGYGWAGIDPTNNIWVTNTHVKLAVGRNFTDCSVVKGTFKGPARQELFVFVSVGYEDGVTFEETNQVQLERQKKAAREEEIARAAESQLQQQQQQQ